MTLSASQAQDKITDIDPSHRIRLKSIRATLI